MSFAIIKTGGKQYKVKTSDIIKIEKLDNDKSGKIEFDKVLAYGNARITRSRSSKTIARKKD